MRHSVTYTLRSRFSLPVMASCVALSLVFFGVENGLASQTLKALRLAYIPYINGQFPTVTHPTVFRYYYYVGDTPDVYTAFPFLIQMRYVNSGPPNYLQDWYGYDAPYNSLTGGYKGSFYRLYSSITAATVPDDFTPSDIDSINTRYQNLPVEQKAPLTGPLQLTQLNGIGPTFYDFVRKPVGSSTGDGGVITYDESGNVISSYPDNTGYISGNKPQPDGTFTPTYFTLENDTVVEHSDIVPPHFSELSYNTDLQHYELNVPDYTEHLNKIINKIDNIQSTPNITVTPPNVTVTPSINLSPEITVNPVFSVTNSFVLSSGIEDALYTDTVDGPSNLSTNDLTLTPDEQSSVSSLRDWQTNIPLIGNSIDFGLTTLLGRIPDIGTEYVWMDHTVGSNTRSSALPSFRIFISLERYRDVILALRGFLILFEALLFLVMTYRNIREALKV